MTEEMRKRLEEAAEKQLNCDTCLARKYGECKENLKCRPYRSYLAGAEWGYKEAIALAKEWLEKHLEDDDNYYNEEDLCWIGREEFLTDFESDMNKLWEEKK